LATIFQPITAFFDKMITPLHLIDKKFNDINNNIEKNHLDVINRIEQLKEKCVK
jgi:hypothetical protein